jgi:hypothetical protein
MVQVGTDVAGLLNLLNSWHATSTTVPEVQADSLSDLRSADNSREVAPANGDAIPDLSE